MRVTQTMMARQYTKRVSGSLGDLNYTNKQAGTGRKFFRGAENPAGAAKAYQLRRQASQVNDYLSNLNEMQSSLETKESSMTQVSKSLEDAYASLLGVMNGTENTTEVKQIVAQSFRSIQETIVKDMNTKYGDKFIFGGGSVNTVPFDFRGNTLYYRGVDVSGFEDYTWPEDGSPNAGKKYLGLQSTDPATGQPSTQVLELLDQLSNDTIYTDLGFGLEFNGDKLISSSAYNSAIPGINVLGYGGTQDYPGNIVLTLGKMAQLLENDADVPSLDPYLGPFKEQKQRVLNAITKTGSDSMFLDYTKNRLENLQDNIDNKIADTEYIDAEEAIMHLNTIDYMYQALLKTSNKILSNSFIDFMS